MGASGLDRRTMANMQLALDRACKGLPEGKKHSARQLIVAKLLESARRGDTSLTALTRAAKSAAPGLARPTRPATTPNVHR